MTEAQAGRAAAAVPPNRVLLAEGRDRKRGTGFYDVMVTAEDGTPVAAAHCIAHRVNG